MTNSSSSSCLSKSSKIYVAGHHGLVGSAIWNNLKARGYHNLVGRSHSELDLTDQYAVQKFFDEERPDAVVLAAAFVGGIIANSLSAAGLPPMLLSPVDFVALYNAKKAKEAEEAAKKSA